MNGLLLKSAAEFMGVLLFFTAIWTTGKDYIIALALLLAIVLFGPISGGHFNGTVTAMKWLTGSVGSTQALAYLVAQLVGGVAAVGLSNVLTGRR